LITLLPKGLIVSYRFYWTQGKADLAQSIA